MPAGELRELVAFEERSDSDDGYGNITAGPFVQRFAVPARIKPSIGIGSETVQAARLAGQQPVVIRVRLTRDTAKVTPDWRAKNARTGTLYNIKSLANLDEHGAYLDVLAVAGEATG